MGSTSSDARRHTTTPLSPSNMDPQQLARFVASQAPRSPVIAGLVMRHRLSGRVLANSPEEIVDSLSQDMSEIDQLAFTRLYLSIRTTSHHETNRRRPLREIVEQIDSIQPLSPITHDTPLPAQDPPEAAASSLWDFDTGSNVPGNTDHTPPNDDLSVVGVTEATTDEEFSQISHDDFDDSISIASSADDTLSSHTYSDTTWIPMHARALLALGDPLIVTGNRAMQERIARLTATVTGAALSSSTDIDELANQSDTGHGYADAQVQTDAPVSANPARTAGGRGTGRGPLTSDYQTLGPGASAMRSRSRIIVDISIAIN